jgi:ketosteroid isomerase-like protein
MKRSVIVLLLLGVSGTLGAQDRVATERDAEEVKATLVAMWAAIEQGEVERYATYIHPDITVFGENDVYLAADWVKRAPGVHTEMHQPQVTVRGDVAWITYYWTDSGVQEGERFSTRGKSTRIFVKQGGRWLCIHAHFTAVP